MTICCRCGRWWWFGSGSCPGTFDAACGHAPCGGCGEGDLGPAPGQERVRRPAALPKGRP